MFNLCSYIFGTKPGILYTLKEITTAFLEEVERLQHAIFIGILYNI